MFYDGNGNIAKTTDFKAVSHYYAYDGLNRMTGHGSNSGANVETYAYACCSALIAYTDAMGTADLDYDQLNRLISHLGSNGNTVTCVYDAMGRWVKITPAQGSNYRTEYLYNKNGSVSTVKVYVSGSNVDTSYSYNSTSGKLTQRNDPPRQRRQHSHQLRL